MAKAKKETVSHAGRQCKLLFVQGVIQRNPMEASPQWLRPWEVEVAGEAFGEKLSINDDKLLEQTIVVPTAEEEMARLVRRWGAPKEENSMPFAETVFGTGSRGLRALDAAIAEAIAGGELLPEADEAEGEAK